MGGRVELASSPTEQAARVWGTALGRLNCREESCEATAARSSSTLYYGVVSLVLV